MNRPTAAVQSRRVVRGAFYPRGVRWQPFAVENTGSTNHLWLGSGPSGDWLLKWYRYPKVGIHPESEISKFLKDQNFGGVAEFGGYLETKTDEGWATVAFVQRWLKGQSVWEKTVGVMQAGPAPLDIARDLGRSIGRLHRVLGSGNTTSSFTAEPWTKKSKEAWVDRISAGLKRLKQACQRAVPSGIDPADWHTSIQLCLKVIEQGPRRLEQISDLKIEGEIQRIHGDLHLGQILELTEGCGENRFAIVDFEGEPMRPVDERRWKDLPLRDVAGMFRSFAYAAAVARAPVTVAERWSAEFLEGWREYMPLPVGDWRPLLEGLIWEKAVYEAEYEVLHRPDWLWIPLRVFAGK